VFINSTPLNHPNTLFIEVDPHPNNRAVRFALDGAIGAHRPHRQSIVRTSPGAEGILMPFAMAYSAEPLEAVRADLLPGDLVLGRTYQFGRFTAGSVLSDG
jgi:hypothetical protein